MVALLCTKARLLDPVLHVVHSVPMSALVGLMVPRRPLVAELSYDERALVWGPTHRKWSHPASHDTRDLQGGPLQTLATETTCLGTTSCLSGSSPRLGATTGEQKLICRGDVHDRALVFQGLLIASFPTLLRLRVSIFLVCCSFYLH